MDNMEWAKKYFEGNPDKIVRTKEIGSFSFWYMQPSGHHKIVCRTYWNHKNKCIKKIWFRIKLFFYKLTHNTNYRPPNKFNDVSVKY